MNEQHDSSRIGGGVGDRLEITAKNIFNWWTQLYAVFYDEPHYGAVMGNAAAVEYVSLTAENLERKFVVTVAPNSMAPKDEMAERNQATTLAQEGFLDPINLFKALNDADPVQTAEMVTLFRVNPQLYMQQYFPQQAQQLAQQPQLSPIQPQPGAPPQGGGSPPGQSLLSQVPIQKI